MSKRWNRFWPAGLAVLLAIAGCGTGQESGPPTGHAADGSVSAEEAALRNPDRLDPSSFQDMRLLADGLDLRLARAVRACMADQGFPQLVEAEQLAVSYQAEGKHNPVRIDPLELGPYAPEQARRYGMVGTPLQFSDGEPGSVISEDKAFDTALDDCYERFSRRADDDVQALLARFAELQNTVRSQFLDATMPEIEALSLRRLQCVRDAGYPRLDPKQAWESRSFEEMLLSIGITPAQIRQETPLRPELGPGQVVVVPPIEKESYTPTEAEVAFALTYVDCTERLDFLDRLETIQSAARTQVLAPHEPEVLELGNALRAAVEATAAEG